MTNPDVSTATIRTTELADLILQREAAISTIRDLMRLAKRLNAGDITFSRLKGHPTVDRAERVLAMLECDA